MLGASLCIYRTTKSKIINKITNSLKLQAKGFWTAYVQKGWTLASLLSEKAMKSLGHHADI